MRIGVIFGGRSVEHDVSIVTAHQCMEVLASSHEVVPIYVTREGRWLTSDKLFDLEVYRREKWSDVGEECYLPAGPRSALVVTGRRKSRAVPIDVFVPAVHGTFGEDGTLQGLLDLADVPYTGSKVAASAIGMDKAAMKAAFRSAGLAVVDDVLVEVERLDSDPDGIVDLVTKTVGLPAFTKPARAGSSVGIARADDRQELLDALDVARRYDRRILVERAMTGCIEINCSVLGGAGRAPRASVCEQPVGWEKFLTFEDKYMRGSKDRSTKGSGVSSRRTNESGVSSRRTNESGMAGQDRRIPAPISDALTKQVQDNALRAFKSVDASGVARIDCFVDESSGDTWVMEINTMPGSFAFYLWEASGLSFSELMKEQIQIALDEHAARSELLFTYESGMLEDMAKGSKTARPGRSKKGRSRG
jgi:D-alanine-D-alanine ligase